MICSLFTLHLVCVRAFSLFTTRVHLATSVHGMRCDKRMRKCTFCFFFSIFDAFCAQRMLHDLMEQLHFWFPCNWLPDHIRVKNLFGVRWLTRMLPTVSRHQRFRYYSLLSCFARTKECGTLHAISVRTHFIHTSYWSSSECSSPLHFHKTCGMQSATHDDYERWLWSGYVECTESGDVTDFFRVLAPMSIQCLVSWSRRWGRKKKEKQIQIIGRIWMGFSKPLYKCYSFRALNAMASCSMQLNGIYLLWKIPFVRTFWVHTSGCVCVCVALVCADVFNACLFSIFAFQFHFFSSRLFFSNLNWLNSFLEIPPRRFDVQTCKRNPCALRELSFMLWCDFMLHLHHNYLDGW